MPKLILVAEDQEDNADIVLTVLMHFGYEAIHAVDGVQAVKVARERNPALILMDVSMPNMDGWEACRALKEDPATRGICVVMLTAHAMEADRDRSFESGAEDYIAKPVEPRRIVEIVKRLIGAP